MAETVSDPIVQHVQLFLNNHNEKWPYAIEFQQTIWISMSVQIVVFADHRHFAAEISIFIIENKKEESKKGLTCWTVYLYLYNAFDIWKM